MSKSQQPYLLACRRGGVRGRCACDARGLGPQREGDDPLTLSEKRGGSYIACLVFNGVCVLLRGGDEKDEDLE